MRVTSRQMAILLGTWFVSTSPAADFSWTTGTDVLVPFLNSQDADAGVVKNGPHLDVQTALEHDWSRYRGTNLDDLAALPPARRDASFIKVHGDDIFWTNAIWQDANGKRHAIVHIEYSYAVPKTSFLWKRRIGLATSTDQGANWRYEGDILTTNPARPKRVDRGEGFQDFGCGDTYLCVDRRNGWFYLYYMTAWVYIRDGWRADQELCVARAPISQKMAPGSWKKWQKGSWNQNGLGGMESPVFTDTDAAVVHFNTYLNRFVVIGHDSDSTSWISSATSLATQDWQPKDFSFPERIYWYNWPIDPVTQDRYEIGQKFRLYSAQANVGGKGTKYFNVTLSKNGNLAPTVDLIQPEESAQAYSPGPLTLIATASDSAGAVSKVEFFANQIKIGEKTSAPYIFIWKNVPVGNYRLSARATDDLDAATESAGVNISLSALTFDLWKNQRGLPVSTPPGAIGGSGRPILVDYALNLDYEPLPQPVLANGEIRLTYPKCRSDVTYQVECSVDLQNWTTQGVEQGMPTPILVTATAPTTGEKGFLHLRLITK